MSGLALSATSVWLICRAAQHPDLRALGIAVVAVRTLAFAKAALRYCERLAAHDGALRLLAGIRARVFSALEPLAPSGLASIRRGDLLRRFTVDVDGAQEALVRAAIPIAGAAATAAGAVVLAGLLAWKAAAILLAGLTLAGIAVPLLTARLAGAGTGGALGVQSAGRRDGLVAGLDKNKFDVRVVSHDEAQRLLDTAHVFGEMVIPPTFSKCVFITMVVRVDSDSGGAVSLETRVLSEAIELVRTLMRKQSSPATVWASTTSSLFIRASKLFFAFGELRFQVIAQAQINRPWREHRILGRAHGGPHATRPGP